MPVRRSSTTAASSTRRRTTSSRTASRSASSRAASSRAASSRATTRRTSTAAKPASRGRAQPKANQRPGRKPSISPAPLRPDAPRPLTGLNPVVSAEVQRRTLNAVFERVREVALSGGRPVVEIDLDLTALMPTQRIHNALRQLATTYNVPELRNPERLPMIPGYTYEAWADWVDRSGLGARYPALRGVGSLDGGLYWVADQVHTDTVTPGLRDFVNRISQLGGTVVFNSGRTQSNAEEAARTALRAGGLDNVNLLIGNSGFSDAGNKQQREAEVARRFGQVVAIFDDRKSNRDAMMQAINGQVISVAIAIPGYSCAPDAKDGEYRVSTFQS